MADDPGLKSYIHLSSGKVLEVTSDCDLVQKYARQAFEIGDWKIDMKQPVCNYIAVAVRHIEVIEKL